MKVKKIPGVILAVFLMLIAAISYFLITELSFWGLNLAYNSTGNTLLAWILEPTEAERLYLFVYPVSIAIYLIVYNIFFRLNKSKIRASVNWDLKTGIISSVILGVAFGGISTLWVELLARSPLSNIDFIKISLAYLKHSSTQTSTATFITGLLVAGILGPVTEELLYRGIIFGLLEKYSNKWTALILSSVMFGFVHLSFVQSVYAGIMGLIAGIVYMKTRKLIWPILMHITINTVSTFGLSSNIMWVIFTVIMLIPLGVIIRGLLKAKKDTVCDENCCDKNYLETETANNLQ